MLRVSAQTTSTNINIQGINGDATAAETGIEFGRELMQFAEAVAGRDDRNLETARQQLLDIAGESVLVDAAGVAANFQRMVRIADAAGIPIDDMQEEMRRQIRQELDIARFPSARNSMP